MNHTATYSPEDNKLRIYPTHRFPREEYDRLKAAGFSWAPKQELFVAPMWTPEREDLAIEFCGEIGDEDKSLVERAEERSERFEDYSEKRMEDAESARKGVSAIADNIPFGQPILVGHHSEKHARRDAERIENGMRKAVKMWETSKYWTDRAASALSHAKYKELPSVRARRIKGLESLLRKQQTHAKPPTANPYEFLIRDEQGEPKRSEAGKLLVDWPLCKAKTEELREGWTVPVRVIRWIAHFENRLSYERAMLSESGGTEADQIKPEKGGACRCWASPRGGYSLIQKVNKVSVTLLDNWDNGGNDFTRIIPFDKLTNMMSLAMVEEARKAGRVLHETKRGFYLLTAAPAVKPTEAPKEPTLFDAMKETLKEGIQVVTAHNLFPTPPEIAKRVVELADIQDGNRILEPSAGTGNLLLAIQPSHLKKTVAVELNSQLADILRNRGQGWNNLCVEVVNGDFLSQNGNLGKFDRIVMNPPFDHGSDIKHIQHALGFLNPGGKLVAICANGPRQQEAFKDADQWIDLPEGSFDGTGVRTAIVVLTR